MPIGDELVHSIPTHIYNSTVGLLNGRWERSIWYVGSKDSWGGKKHEIWRLVFQVNVKLNERYKVVRTGSVQGAVLESVTCAIED